MADKKEELLEEDIKEEKTEKVEKAEEVKENQTEEKDSTERKDYRRNTRNPRDNREYNQRGNRDDFRFRRMRRKVCLLCKEKDYVLDYKDAETLNRFINEKAKILPRRATGTCAKHQREIAKIIKRARHIAVIPYTSD